VLGASALRGWCLRLFVARVREIAQGLEIILRQRHEGFATPRPAPAIALDAADEPLAVVVDLDQRALAVGSFVNINHPGRLSGAPFTIS
jgi:hypothetical protein